MRLNMAPRRSAPFDQSTYRGGGMGTLNRRDFLAGVTALSASAVLHGCASTDSASGGGKPYSIDVHHHFVTPTYSAALQQNNIRGVTWTVGGSLAELDKSGIATAVLSLPPPGVTFGDVALGRKLARDANEYAAKLVQAHPGRYGSFAALPLRDADGTLAEMAYALDTLKAEGLSLMTSYDGKHLGDPAFWPILEEINRRKATVYTHPTPPACCAKILPMTSVNTIEGPVDTTRTMVSLLLTGAAARYPDIQWIFSHSGGVLPFLLSRLQVHEASAKDSKQIMPNGLAHELRKFYYDLAQGNHPGALDALIRIAPVSQFLYGTDYPFRDGAEMNAALAKYDKFSAADRRAINRDNALRILPALTRG
jgi:6-methylsalicylate decarboxylase